jgi:chaperone BCS1
LTTIDFALYCFSEVSKTTLLRSEDVDFALRILAEFLWEKRRRTRKETKDKKDSAAEVELRF